MLAWPLVQIDDTERIPVSVCLVPELDGHIWRGRQRNGGMERGAEMSSIGRISGHVDSWLI